jgi:hypothetical protein
MYALARNSWKFAARDKRQNPRQHIEFDSLAPDTVEEMFAAMRLLEVWTGRASLRARGESAEGRDESELAQAGAELLAGLPEATADLEILADNVENSRRRAVVTKAREGRRAYRQMIHYYAVKNLLQYLKDNPEAGFTGMRSALEGPRQTDWVNFGGQLVPGPDAAQLRSDIADGTLDCWNTIHSRYDELWERYPRDRQRHAFAALEALTGGLTEETWNAALDEAVRIQRHIADETYKSRKKDYENPFRRMTFEDDAENLAVMGSAEENSFVAQVREETAAFESLCTRGRG